MPTSSRASFIIVNIARMPRCGSPKSQPVACSKLMTQVADPESPILCSMPAHITPFLGPASPSALGRNFGTRNREIPLMPLGASGRRASTRWMMFSDRSCSPAEMKILVPVTR